MNFICSSYLKTNECRSFAPKSCFRLKSVYHPSYQASHEDIQKIIKEFDVNESYVAKPARNAIKAFDLNGERVTVKRFKIPNFINKLAYKFLRKSKAERSFTYANKLLELGIGTPRPIAYFEETSAVSFLSSYYMCAFLDADFTFRELINDDSIPDVPQILRAFTRFTFQLHENNVLFKDHSPGNTLIKRTTEGVEFYLVDLNRMEFKPLTFEERVLNFIRLTPKEDMVAIMSDEYARLTGRSYDEVFSLMWGQTEAFQKKYWRKVRLKQKWLFWRKKK